MPESGPLRFAIKDFLPASFAERGTHVPFTSPMLAHARLRVSPRGMREVVIRNPGGGDGWYVGNWHSMINSARLSVHDRLLYRRIDAAEAMQPLDVRRIAREVALEGFAGRAARDAAEAALAGEARALVQTHVGLLARLLRQAGAPERADALAGVQSDAELRRVAPGMLDGLQSRTGQLASVLADRVAALAALLAPVGLCPMGEGAGNHGLLASDLAGLHALVRALDAVGADRKDDDGEADPALVIAVQRAADAAIRLAEAARAAALAGADHLLAAPAVGDAAADPRGQHVLRMAWLLDGWPALAAVWHAAQSRGAQAMRRALVEIAMNLPPLPREMAGHAPPPLAGAMTLPPQRWVRAGQDWLTGVAERDMAARNEMLLARAI
jgi:hypothetical protein